jgi:ACT domain-containing protein
VSKRARYTGCRLHYQFSITLFIKEKNSFLSSIVDEASYKTSDTATVMSSLKANNKAKAALALEKASR